MELSTFLKRSPLALVVVIAVVAISLFAAIASSELPRKTQSWLILLVSLGSLGAYSFVPPPPLRKVEPDFVEVRGVLGWARAIALFVQALVFLFGVYTGSLNLVIASTSLVAASSLNLVFDGAGRLHGNLPGRMTVSVRRVAKSNFWIFVVSVIPACLIVLATLVLSGDSLGPLDYLPPILLVLTSIFVLLQCREVEINSAA